MAPSRRRVNPFYVFTVLTGILFTITACVYGIMTIQQMNRVDLHEANRLLHFMEQHGLLLIGVELAVLAVVTVGAIATDGFWERARGSTTTEERS